MAQWVEVMAAILNTETCSHDLVFGNLLWYIVAITHFVLAMYIICYFAATGDEIIVQICLVAVLVSRFMLVETLASTKSIDSCDEYTTVGVKMH